MELSCQKHLFSLEKNTHYLNCGAYSPLLSKSKYAGIKAVETKANPQQYTPSMHFEGPNMISAKVGELINCEADRVAVIPSVSYGLAVVANNLHRIKDIENKRNIVVLQSTFPNHYYGFERVGKHLHLEMKGWIHIKLVTIGINLFSVYLLLLIS
jgi:kynureninase